MIASLTIHEIGHLIGSLILKIKINRITLSCLGGLILFDNKNSYDLRRVVILFFLGPLTNIFIGSFLLLFWLYHNQYSLAIFPIKETLENSLGLLTAYNLIIGFVNLIPILPFDGGDILNQLLNTKIKNRKKNKMKLFIYYNEIFYIIIILLTFYAIISHLQYSMLIIILYILLLYNDFQFKWKRNTTDNTTS